MAKRSSKITELQTLFSGNNISAETIELNDDLIFELKKRAGTIKDYRNESYTRHLLVDVIMIMFFAMLSNANEWGEIEVFAKSKDAWLRKYLELPNGIPTDDTIRIIIGNIDSKHFYTLVVQYLIEIMNIMLELGGSNLEQSEPDIISVDGKESRGSKRERTDKLSLNYEVEVEKMLSLMSINAVRNALKM